MATKQRIHREWFRPVSLGNRKSCPDCHAKLHNDCIWSWGEYVNGKWRTIQYFCRGCFPSIQERLLWHGEGCGCIFELVGYHCLLPLWISLVKEPEGASTRVGDVK